MVNNVKERAVFTREIRTLLIILVIYCLGYLFRFAFDISFSNFDKYETNIMYLIVSIFCDFIPVAILIIFHYRNFRESK